MLIHHLKEILPTTGIQVASKVVHAVVVAGTQVVKNVQLPMLPATNVKRKDITVQNVFLRQLLVHKN